MNVEYVIVQAGGKGTRLGKLTANRPKSLVPINNRPILFHLFEEYPNKKFIVIGDYRFHVLSRYLDCFSPTNCILIRAEKEGNVAGLRSALKFIPSETPFMLTWSDLLIDENLNYEDLPDGCYVGVTDSFPCSWRFEDGRLIKTPSEKNCVAGFFLFDKKSRLESIPEEGSFTKYLSTLDLPLSAFPMGKTREAGTLSAVNALDSKENRCRPYNKMTFDGDKVIKEGLTAEGRKLIEREELWYKELSAAGFRGIPKIYSYSPLTMERIHGDNIFKAHIADSQKKEILDTLMDRLQEMHSLKPGKPNYFDMWEDYYAKTMKRIRSIQNVIPFADLPEILINGKTCVNVLSRPEYLRTQVEKIMTESEFGIIHGDCTLTNTMIDENNQIYFIDARGYFGKTALVGDVYYDWAKVYYSIQGSFDQFNVKNFTLAINETDVQYDIHASGWEHLTEYFLSRIPNCDVYRLKLIHAIIWLSLASHCWEDYDSLCLAFYNGLYLLNSLEE